MFLTLQEHSILQFWASTLNTDKVNINDYYTQTFKSQYLYYTEGSKDPLQWFLLRYTKTSPRLDGSEDLENGGIREPLKGL